MKADKTFSALMSILGICINYLWGGLDTMLIALLVLMVADFLSGSLSGAKDHELDSKKAYEGITKKKMMILIMVAISVVADRLLGSNGSVRSATIFFYISIEGISIIENAGKLGLPIPSIIKPMFKQLQDSERR